MRYYTESLTDRVNESRLTTTPVAVGVYARVSTDNEGQKESCANQVEMAKYFIKKHPNIKLTDIYIDDGISGQHDDTRKEYRRLLNDVRTKRIEVIIVKTFSRLNRDEFNSLALVNFLIDNEATVLTLEDGRIHNFEDPNDDLLHSIQFTMDAYYVRQQSKRARETQARRVEKKELSAKDVCFGYKWDKATRTISIDPDKSIIVTSIFEEYVYRNGKPDVIRRNLEEQGITLSIRSISKILQDERFIGRFYINRQTTKLGRGKNHSKRIPLPRDQWVLVERPDLQIVDSDLFYMAQKVRSNRQTLYIHPDKVITRSYFQGTHLFAGKIFCANCGLQMHHGYSDRKKSIPIYRVRTHSKCSHPAPRVYEEDITSVVLEALSGIIRGQESIIENLKMVLEECAKEAPNNVDKIAALKRQSTQFQKKIDNLTDTLAEGGLSGSAKDRIIEKINTFDLRLSEITNDIATLESAKLDQNFIDGQIAEIRNGISSLTEFKSLTRARILNYISRIEINEKGDIDIFFNTGIANKSSVESVVKTGTQDIGAHYQLVTPIPALRC